MFSTQLIHVLLLPPGLHCILALLALLFAWRGRRYTATVLALVTIFSLYALATPIGAQWLAQPLESQVLVVHDLSQLRVAGYQAIVVLGGGRTPQAAEYAGADVPSPSVLARLRYAALVHRQSGLPLLVSGGMPLATQQSEAALMADSLRNDFGVPVRWLESQSMTTEENAERTAEILRAEGITRIVLVSHAVHLPRAQANFQRAGFTVLAAPTEFTTPSLAYATFERWTPKPEAFGSTCRSLHEWLGLLRDNARQLLKA